MHRPTIPLAAKSLWVDHIHLSTPALGVLTVMRPEDGAGRRLPLLSGLENDQVMDPHLYGEHEHRCMVFRQTFFLQRLPCGWSTGFMTTLRTRYFIPKYLGFPAFLFYFFLLMGVANKTTGCNDNLFIKNIFFCSESSIICASVFVLSIDQNYRVLLLGIFLPSIGRAPFSGKNVQYSICGLHLGVGC